MISIRPKSFLVSVVLKSNQEVNYPPYNCKVETILMCDHCCIHQVSERTRVDRFNFFSITWSKVDRFSYFFFTLLNSERIYRKLELKLSLLFTYF